MFICANRSRVAHYVAMTRARESRPMGGFLCAGMPSIARHFSFVDFAGIFYAAYRSGPKEGFHKGWWLSSDKDSMSTKPDSTHEQAALDHPEPSPEAAARPQDAGHGGAHSGAVGGRYLALLALTAL